MDTRFHLFRRSYRDHVPSNYSSETPTPLVIVIHGAFSKAKLTEKETGFSRLADKKSFIALYPMELVFSESGSTGTPVTAVGKLQQTILIMSIL